MYRVIAAIGILSVHFFNKNKIDKRRQNTATIVGAAIVATMVALMIEKYGGHESPYFVGIILTIFFVVGLTSLNVKMSIITSIIVYAIYLFPILVYDTITNIPLFINANIFIIATIFATVILRYLIQQRFVSEFGLQYDLEKKKEQLEEYSTQLEELVQERTRELSISEKWHKSIFDNATDGVIVQDRNGAIVNVNKKACEIHGFERDSLIGVNIELLEARGDKKQIDERERQLSTVTP